MSKESKDSQSNSSPAGGATIPSWVKIAGVILIGALGYTQYQKSQAQGMLEQAGMESAEAKKAITMVKDAQAETMKKTDALKKELNKLKEEAATQNKMATTLKEMAASLKEKANGLMSDLSASKGSVGSLQDKLKAAGAKLSMAMAESEKSKMAATEQEKLLQQYKSSQDIQAAAMKEMEILKQASAGFKAKISSLESDLSASTARVGSLQGELKAANGKLVAALAQSEKNKQAAEVQAKLASEYKEKAERAAAQ